MKNNLTIIFGSVRDNSSGEKLLKIIEKKLKKSYNLKIIHPKKYNLPLLNKTYKDYGSKAPKKLKEIHNILKKSDGFIILSPEYNHSIPPALSNTLDYFYEEFFYKPSGIITYSNGSFGGSRVAVQLRVLLGELGMPAIKTIVYVPKIDEVLDNENFKEEKLDKNFNNFMKELDWYINALKKARIN